MSAKVGFLVYLSGAMALAAVVSALSRGMEPIGASLFGVGAAIVYVCTVGTWVLRRVLAE